MKSKDFSYNSIGRYTLSVLIVFILCWSCKKEENAGPMTMEEMILGRWDWYQSIIPKPHAVITPGTQGFTESLQFLTNDSVRLYRDDTLKLTSYYEVLYKPLDFLNPTGDSIWVVTMYFGSVSRLTLTSDTLILDRSYVDGSTDYYTRSH